MAQLHTDIPTRSQIERLLTDRTPGSVSIYFPTSRLPQDADKNRIVLKNLAASAIEQLMAVETPEPDDVHAINEAFAHLDEAEGFWELQADSLAVFVTPTNIQTYRLPNHLSAMVEVSNRFHLKPLLRTVTFPQAAYVLALSQGGVRLLEIGPSGAPEEIRLHELPDDVWDSGGNKVFKSRERNYAHQIDHALRPVLSGSDLPLILASTEMMAGVFRTVNTYPHLIPTRNAGNPEATTDAELASAARGILDEVYAEQLAETRELFELRSSQGRAASDISEVARLATMGAVDTVFVDIDETVPGFIDEGTGTVTFDDTDDAVNYGVIDEIARRVYLASGRVLAVRRDDIPGGGSVAAILRYAI